MANINASALNSLQTRINAERSRRSLSPVTFTDGTLSAGGTIKATHFAELRTYTEGLNTLGSQTFNWSGNIAVGASITDVITQISNFVTTLEGEALASWTVLQPDVRSRVREANNDAYYGWNYSNIGTGISPASNVYGPWTTDTYPTPSTEYVYTIPPALYGTTGTIRITYNGGLYSNAAGGFRGYATAHYLTQTGWNNISALVGPLAGLDYNAPWCFQGCDINTGTSCTDALTQDLFLSEMCPISFDTVPYQVNTKGALASPESAGAFYYYYQPTKIKEVVDGTTIYSTIAPSATNKYIQAQSWLVYWTNPVWLTVEVFM